MNIFRTIIQFYLYSNLHIAICALSILVYTQLVMISTIDTHYTAFVFSGTLCLYASHRLYGIRILQDQAISKRFEIIIKHKSQLFLYALISGTASIYYYIQMDRSLQLLSVIPLLFSAAYILPIFTKKKRLRDYALIKIFVIAFCWALFTGFIPLVGKMGLNTALILGLERMIFIIAITIPFDIRDKGIDVKQKVTTLVTKIGVKRAQLLSMILFLFAAVILLWCKSQNIISNYYFIPLICSYIIGTLLVAKANSEKSDYYFTGWIDGLLSLPLIILIIIRYCL